jgi:hypothetical protein
VKASADAFSARPPLVTQTPLQAWQAAQVGKPLEAA